MIADSQLDFEATCYVYDVSIPVLCYEDAAAMLGSCVSLPQPPSKSLPLKFEKRILEIEAGGHLGQPCPSSGPAADENKQAPWSVGHPASVHVSVCGRPPDSGVSL